MPIVYNQIVKDARLQVVADAIDGGGSNGAMVLWTAGMANAIVSIPLAHPCGSVANGALTLTPVEVLAFSGAANSVPVLAEIVDSTGAVVANGLVVGIDVVLNFPYLVPGQNITVTSAVITAG